MLRIFFIVILVIAWGPVSGPAGAATHIVVDYGDEVRYVLDARVECECHLAHACMFCTSEPTGNDSVWAPVEHLALYTHMNRKLVPVALISEIRVFGAQSGRDLIPNASKGWRLEVHLVDGRKLTGFSRALRVRGRNEDAAPVSLTIDPAGGNAVAPRRIEVYSDRLPPRIRPAAMRFAICPVDSARFTPPAYRFCPVHGDTLIQPDPR